MSNELQDVGNGILVDDTPQPSSSSGMRFEELYRLKGVVSV